MTNEQALKIVAEFEAVLPAIKKALGQTIETEKPNPTPTQTAKEYLLEILSKPFEVKITEGFIDYYQDAEWVFRQDLKNGILWCNFFKVRQFFETTYSMKYQQIQAFHEEVVCEDLNCKGFTSVIFTIYLPISVCEALNCKGFTSFEVRSSLH